MDKYIFQSVMLTSAIIGIITGVVAVIPVINVLAFLSVFILVSIYSLNKCISLIKPQNMNNQIVTTVCASSGFVCAFCACVSFIPCVLLFNVYGLAKIFNGLNLLFLIFIAFFFALICAMTNAFIGFIMWYIYSTLKK